MEAFHEAFDKLTDKTYERIIIILYYIWKKSGNKIDNGRSAYTSHDCFSIKFVQRREVIVVYLETSY